MRAKSMALILVALACGLVATIGVSQVMKENAQTDTVPLGDIVITTQNLDIGAPLNEENVKLEQWPMDRIPPGAIRSLEETEGKYAGQFMFPSEPLLAAKLMDSNVDSSTKIEKGYRVAAVKVSEESAVANLIKPGDRVDVIAYIKSRGSGDSQRAKTFLRNIRVFAVNAETSRAIKVDGEDGNIDAKTVSLLVKPEQVQRIVLAEQLGKIELSLRHPDDDTEDTADETSIEDFFGDSGSSSKNPLGGMGSILSTVMSKPAPPSNEDEPFRMQVMTPDGFVTFKWEDEDKLPTMEDEQTYGATSASAPAGSPAAAPTPVELPPGLVPAPAPPQPSNPFVGDV